VAALQEAMALTLFGQATRYPRAILLYGEGNTGKTQLIEIMAALMPPGCSTALPPHDWGDKFKVTRLHGKLLNQSGELPESGLIEGDKFKLIVEGSPILGQDKGKPIFEFEPQAAHWFASNHLPQSRDGSTGFTRRWLILGFDRVIPEGERIIGLGKEILAEEGAAIVAWAAQAMPRLRANRDYTLSASHRRRIGEVANNTNSVRYFLTECRQVRLVPFAVVGEGRPRSSEIALHELYQRFCIQHAQAKAVGLRRFRAQMREVAGELGFALQEEATAQGHRVVWFEGVAQLDEAGEIVVEPAVPVRFGRLGAA
jgi:P4 family phage/plasmid primase-like protien